MTLLTILAVAGWIILILAAMLICGMARVCGQDQPAPSAGDYWQGADRIKAAVLAANAEGIERLDLSKVLTEDA